VPPGGIQSIIAQLLYALENGTEAALPEWAGEAIFALEASPPAAKASVYSLATNAIIAGDCADKPRDVNCQWLERIQTAAASNSSCS
jgi:hypothetical protein